MRIQGILETVVYAHDLDAAERFYADVLGLEVFAREPGRHVFFRCGQGMFLVFDPRSTSREDATISDVPRHGAEGPGHMAFAVATAELASWRRRLADHGVPLEHDLAWPHGGHSLYFRDPAGNSIELATPRLWGLDPEGLDPATK